MFLLCASITNHDSPLKEFQQEQSRPINVMSDIMILFAKLKHRANQRNFQNCGNLPPREDHKPSTTNEIDSMVG
jgi:hypothetical protein